MVERVSIPNWLSWAYFLPVRPLHQLIVPAILRSALRQQACESMHSGA